MARRIFVAGHRGMVGSAICRRLADEPVEVVTRSRQELDLTDQAAVHGFFRETPVDAVILAAARVGGILANSERPVDFLYDNLQIQNNVIHAAAEAGVQRLLFLGSSCIYPKLAEQPIREDALMTAPLEPTNQWYAVAKIAGVYLCQAYRQQHGLSYISAMPTNLYGPNDNFDLKTSHVLPALIRKFVEARDAGRDEVELWGSGTPLREFMHVDDLADALAFLLDAYDGAEPINAGSGQEISIGDLARLIARETGYSGTVRLDPSKPDGTPRKLMDSSRLTALGWSPKISLEEGIRSTIRWFEDNRPTD
ncbi:GDP-L-fucose synthase [Stappia stellulata]|uniref:GDP-L-fucose synthase family protein n=1 Tax=Stappia stellulata TaxID=71235 RepID=UPI001CD2D13A|nr:GDP-L-fucose synthase [Stappia stellulata]MCA1244056.1 GDP-L-fucose synthase [Stappia stellulata]